MNDMPRRMNGMPLTIIFLLIYFNAVIRHIKKRCVGVQLIGQHCHICIELYAWGTKIILVGKQLSGNGFQNGRNSSMVVNAFRHYSIKIAKTVS